MKLKRNKMGATVRYCGHDAVFMADIFVIEGAAVVRANGPVTMDTVFRPAKLFEPTHHLVDYPATGFWRPDLGVFVVPTAQVRVLPAPKKQSTFKEPESAQAAPQRKETK